MKGSWTCVTFNQEPGAGSWKRLWRYTALLKTLLSEGPVAPIALTVVDVSCLAPIALPVVDVSCLLPAGPVAPNALPLADVSAVMCVGSKSTR